MQSKMDIAKEGLQSMISHWKKEWRDVITKWSNQIIIEIAAGKIKHRIYSTA